MRNNNNARFDITYSALYSTCGLWAVSYTLSLRLSNCEIRNYNKELQTGWASCHAIHHARSRSIWSNALNFCSLTTQHVFFLFIYIIQVCEHLAESGRVGPVLTLLIGPSHLRVTGGHFSFWRIHPAPCSTVNKTNKQTSLSELVEYSLVMGELRSRVLILPSFLPSFHLWRQFQTLTIEIHNKMPLIQIWKQTTLPCVRVMYYWLSTVSTCVFKSTFFIEKQKNYLRVRKKNKKTLSLCRVIAFISK